MTESAATNGPVLLRADQVQPFERFTAPFYRSLLQRADPEGDTLAIGYRALGLPAGLLLADLSPTRARGFVSSVSVARIFRRKGIATNLLHRLEEMCRTRRMASVMGHYLTDNPDTLAIERLLKRADWALLQAYTVCTITKADGARLMRAGWMRRPALSAGFEIQPWYSVTEEEVARLVTEDRRRPFFSAQNLSPAVKTFHRDTSLVLRHDGRIIGWMINRRISRNTLLYERLFVRPEYQQYGLAVTLLIETIHRHYPFMHPEDRAGWVTRLENKPMMQFIDTGMAPYLSSRTQMNEIIKKLDERRFIPYDEMDPPSNPFAETT